MSAGRVRLLAWIAILVAAAWLVVHARYVADLSAFLPAHPSAEQRVLVEQLRDGPASRLLLIALEGGTAAQRARVSVDMAGRLRALHEFASVENGTPWAADRDREYLFIHRYLLSDAVTPQRFSAQGLHAAIEQSIEDLAGSSGMLLTPLLAHDPTGEMLRIVDRLEPARGPRTRDGAWLSADGTRTVLLAQTAAAGSDTDAQERALRLIEAAFHDATSTSRAAAPGAAAPGAIRIRLSGPGVFAVGARARIERAATRLSLLSGLLVIAVLYSVYRSFVALALGLLPVATGALVGVAAVALCFDVVHGVTLGFGVTLIGEAVDYSIYFFIQAVDGAWHRRFWPTVRLGMLTSLCGFASLLPSGFPGLAQLGVYSIGGLAAAGLVTRFVLPELRPAALPPSNLDSLGTALLRALQAVGRRRNLARWAVCGTLLAAVWVLYGHRDTLWNRELSALSPLSADDLRFDALLREDLGTADVLDLIVVRGPTLDAVLAGTERADAALQPLIERGVIGEVDSPARYLPSRATQAARRDAVPERRILQDNLARAVQDLPVEAGTLQPFVDEAVAARSAALLSVENLRGTSLAAGFGALVLQGADGWSGLLPLHSAGGGGTDTQGVAAALAAAGLHDTHLVDLKAQTDALYASYLHEAMRLSLYGLLAIVVLLTIALRTAGRVARVLLPLLLAVLTVAAVLSASGRQLNLLHLVGMLLIVAVGSNYALFFDREGGTSAAPRTLASLAIANLSAVIGFGLLAFSQVPVLEALGTTVAPGALLALLFSAVLTPRAPAHA